MAKKEIVVRQQAKEPANPFADLEAAGAPLAPAVATTKKKNKPTTTLQGLAALILDKWAAAKVVMKHAEGIMKANEPLVKEKGHNVYCETGFKLRCIPPNGVLASERSNTLHMETAGQKLKLNIPAGLTLKAALLNAGVSKATAAILGRLVKTSKETIIQSPQALYGNPETRALALEVKAWMEGLSQEKKDVLLVQIEKRDVDDSLLNEVFVNAKSLEETKAALTVIQPQIAETSTNISFSLADALKIMEGEDETAGTTKKTVTTTVVEEAAA